MSKHFLSVEDFTKEELSELLQRAIVLKKERAEGVVHQQLAGKTVALIFEKASTRTRVSFESAMYGLGGQVLFLAGRDTQLSRSEPLKDTARVMSRYVDGMVVRTYGQSVVDELSEHATVPVINALTDLGHPCQIMSDIMTVIEHKGNIADQKVAWVGDGNNMTNSWIQAAAKLGFELVIACPEGYDPDAEILKRAQAEASKPITIVRDPKEAVVGADVVNTDVFASMGQESEQEERLVIFADYQVNSELMALAKDDAIVLHCLPAHRGEEISEEVLEGPQSVVWDEAENKMHMHKALLEKFLG
ncbi:MAG: ornithine carbamoyltransferase [Desulfotalea sp.]